MNKLKLLSVAILAASSISLSSCGSDDEPKNNVKQKLVGVWKTSMSSSNWKGIELVSDGTLHYNLSIDSSGNYSYSELDKNQSSHWIYNENDQTIFMYSDDGYYSYTYKVSMTEDGKSWTGYDQNTKKTYTFTKAEGKMKEPDIVQPDFTYTHYKNSFRQFAGLPANNQDWGFSYSNGKSIRIIAEDLSATASSDFDFNDVVFDIAFISDTEATIILQAVGSKLPICIGDIKHEAHELFNVSSSIMVNVGTGSQMSPVSFTISGEFAGKAINIPVMVNINDTWYNLTANRGEPASKIAVSTDYTWCSERSSIINTYPQFVEWVSNPNVRWY